MAERLLFALTIIAALGCGLVAGIFFAFSTFIMDALARLSPPQGIAAMQSINITVINPLFFAAFFGTALLCILLAVAAIFTWSEAGAGCLLAGGILYVAGTILVTIAFNVPLNNALAPVDPASAAGAELWSRYVMEWTAWNHVRTVAAAVASALFIIAACYQMRALPAN